MEKRLDPVGQVSTWNDAVLDLFEANLGEAVVLSFLRLSEQWPAQRPIEDAVAVGRAVRNIGQVVGSRIAHAILAELPKVLTRVATTDELTVVFAALQQLADNGPESLGLIVSRLEQLLLHASAEGFSAWVAAGLRSAGGNPARRRAFFGLDDPHSTRLLYGRSGAGDDFTRLERRLGATMLALWNKKPRLRKLAIGAMPAVPRRASLVGGMLGLPETYPGFQAERADGIYLAALAHAGAHLRHSSARFLIGRLKPLQIALISLVEDARVEALALRDMPGLGRLWLPFHTATPSPQATAAGLMVRLARALIDPDYADSDAWVGKGRVLFEAAADRWDDPAISREIGGLLGNDIGQMRLQFNAKSYVVEPTYRDDNLALWEFDGQHDGQVDEIELPVDSVRVERRQDAEGDREDETAPPEETLRARARTIAMLDGFPVATYPEWDYAARIERPDWTTILEADATTLPKLVDVPLDEDVTRRVTTVTRDASIGRRQRYKRQREGDALDVDAAIALMIERRAGRILEPRVYLRDAPGPRDLAILLLLDLSQSTADRDRLGRTILDVERKAAAIITTAVEAADDTIAVHGFNSDGRERVRYVRIKSFDERMDAFVCSRLAGLQSSHSTRLGAALRHAGSYLSQRRAFRKVLLVLTDGEPSDVDVPEPRYLAEDARRAVHHLRRHGIDIFAFGVGNGPFLQIDRIFGERRALRVSRVDVLPQRVVQLYTELKK
ncbi:nitric oxide reductase activation protein NorD [Bradyrhizobium lablabi]|uniref:nitric oxide reductase activation protein NorD n=1 Tax=Bradyrhizobium lablabi TaxID=722472 RepID=UPI001BA96EC2|nr:nitric oxide reductase activation protein NorD [Bradyrhizobium lablabi]MBR0694033.1 nitric oxide reductase activation protein NorD [Bradyrhizobium lablabi]